jgi:hypothetical protein
VPEAPPGLSPMRSPSHRRALPGPAVLPELQTGVPAIVVLPPEGAGRPVMPRMCLLCHRDALPGGSRCELNKLRYNWSKYRSYPRYRSAGWVERRKRQLTTNLDYAICGEPASVADHITAVKLG